MVPEAWAKSTWMVQAPLVPVEVATDPVTPLSAPE